MIKKIIICDICGRKPSKDLVKARKEKNPPGPELHWLKIDTKQYEYLGDDGSTVHDKHYDLCCSCKSKFYKLFQK